MVNTKPVNDYTNEGLNFKYHTQEFIDVSEELRQVGHIGRMAKKNIGVVQDFYDGLEYLDEIYSEYFFHQKEIKELFEESEKLLNSKNYQRDLKSYREGKTNIRNSLYNYEYKIIKRLKKILKLISADTVNSELRPKPTKTKDKYPDIQNHTIKEIIAGFRGEEAPRKKKK